MFGCCNKIFLAQPPHSLTLVSLCHATRFSPTCPTMAATKNDCPAVLSAAVMASKRQLLPRMINHFRQLTHFPSKVSLVAVISVVISSSIRPAHQTIRMTFLEETIWWMAEVALTAAMTVAVWMAAEEVAATRTTNITISELQITAVEVMWARPLAKQELSRKCWYVFLCDILLTEFSNCESYYSLIIVRLKAALLRLHPVLWSPGATLFSFLPGQRKHWAFEDRRSRWVWDDLRPTHW